MQTEGDVMSVPERRHLPDERKAITRKFKIESGHKGYITLGFFDDNTLGEIFVVMCKEGSTLSGFVDAFAKSISGELQYGIPLSEIAKEHTDTRYEPNGRTEEECIPVASSIIDYIVRYACLKNLSLEKMTAIGMKTRCHDCGQAIPHEGETYACKAILPKTA